MYRGQRRYVITWNRSYRPLALNSVTKSTLGKKEFIYFTWSIISVHLWGRSPFLSIFERGQSRNRSSNLGGEKLKQSSWRNKDYCLVSHGSTQSACFLIQPRSTCLGCDHPQWMGPFSIDHQSRKCLTHRHIHRTIKWWQLLNWGSLFTETS